MSLFSTLDHLRHVTGGIGAVLGSVAHMDVELAFFQGGSTVCIFLNSIGYPGLRGGLGCELVVSRSLSGLEPVKLDACVCVGCTVLLCRVGTA